MPNEPLARSVGFRRLTNGAACASWVKSGFGRTSTTNFGSRLLQFLLSSVPFQPFSRFSGSSCPQNFPKVRAEAERRQWEEEQRRRETIAKQLRREKARQESMADWLPTQSAWSLTIPTDTALANDLLATNLPMVGDYASRDFSFSFAQSVTRGVAYGVKRAQGTVDSISAILEPPTMLLVVAGLLGQRSPAVTRSS